MGVATEAPTPPERDDRDRERGRGEHAFLELVRRLVGSGVERLSEGPENLKNLVADLRLPKDLATSLGSQWGELKQELLDRMSAELRRYLDSNRLGDELARALANLTLEVTTELRFVPKPRSEDLEAASQPQAKAPREEPDSDPGSSPMVARQDAERDSRAHLEYPRSTKE